MAWTNLGGHAGWWRFTFFKDTIKTAAAGLLALALLMPGNDALAVAPARVDLSRQAVVTRAARLLDEAQVSYVYGGHQLGDSAACNACNTCLEQQRPAAKSRLKVCPRCQACSLDCSHFTALVFAQANLPYPYLDTAGMIALSAAALEQRYRLIDLGVDLSRALPGDLLVYSGHVVLLEQVAPLQVGRGERRGDVVHATGGKAIQRPGEGIQRERFADLAHFRGPLLRILRHAALAVGEAKRTPPVGPGVSRPGRLRPVAVRPQPDGGGG